MGESATTQAQDVNSRVEEILFPTEDTPETQDDEVVSEDSLEGEDAPEEIPEDDDTDSIEDEEGVDEADLTLASYLGIEDDRLNVEEDGSVTFNAIIDGETKQVPLAELAKSFQLQGHVNNKSMALEAERKEFEQQRDEIAQQFEQRVQQIHSLSKVLEDQLTQDYRNIDWDKLRVDNPSEWTAMRQEFAERASKLKKAQSEVSQNMEQVNQQKQQEMMQQQQAHMQVERQKMIESNPSWSDPEKMQSDLGEVRTFLTGTYGFTEQDLEYVTDHRLVKLIMDAKAFKEGSKNADVKKIKTVPKFQKPGATKAKADQLAKARAVKARKQAVKKTGKVQDVANLILDRM